MPTVAATYEPIQTYTLASNQTTVDFNPIPQTYTDLILVCTIKWTGSGASSWGISFNGDYANNYAVNRFYDYNGTLYSTRDTPTPATQTGQIHSSNWCDNIIQINGYTNTYFWKYALARPNMAVGSVNGLFLGRWQNTSAITSLRCWNFDGGTGAFAQGSIFTLYGVKSA